MDLIILSHRMFCSFLNESITEETTHSTRLAKNPKGSQNLMTDKIVIHNSTSRELQLGRFRLDVRNNFTSVTAQRDYAIPVLGVFKHLH